MSREDLMPAIKLFESRVDEAERKVNDLLAALNMLRAEAGMPPRSPGSAGSGGSGGGSAPAEISPDLFFGKRQQTAIREYLQMRKAQGSGPAKPREIYEALLTGGYQYEAKDAETALVGLRALLRKRTNFFTKLPNGTYGLREWYPDLKRQKPASAASAEDDAEEDVEDDAEETKATSGSIFD